VQGGPLGYEAHGPWREASLEKARMIDCEERAIRAINARGSEVAGGPGSTW